MVFSISCFIYFSIYYKMVRKRTLKNKTIGISPSELLKKKIALKKESSKIITSTFNLKFPKIKPHFPKSIKNNYLINNFKNKDDPTKIKNNFCSKNNIICANIICSLYESIQMNKKYKPISDYTILKELLIPQSKTKNILFGAILIDNNKKNIVIAFRSWYTHSEYKLHKQINPIVMGNNYYAEGALKAYRYNDELIYNTIEHIKKQYPNINIWITGYSFGGAVACITEHMLLNKGYKINGYTYGCPRVIGINDKKMEHNNDFYNVMNLNDSIPCNVQHTTTEIIYQHMGQPIIFNFHGNTMLENHTFYLKEMIIGEHEPLN